MQFAVYRNYNVSAEKLLQYSGWESKPQNLRQFMDSIKQGERGRGFRGDAWFM
jgi:hypothetical protein